jgi:cobalt-zinc-cadmium resistance protein CzcA
MERADIMVALKPKAEWTSAETTGELMEKMEESLRDIPGLDIEISQPIQMRTNELLTGIKQDVAIKIYGDDIEELSRQARKVRRLIEHVPGVSGLFVEEVSGLPQIQVLYNHEQMAAYGISADDINQLVSTAYAGSVVGAIYEGERKVDLMLRLADSLRTDDRLARLYLPLADGSSIPLSQVATIGYANAPAQVSHEDGMRRTFVGFNVKGRDISSTVADIQQIIDSKLKLPEGYYYTFGGEFRNLERASQRLLTVVPIALLVILLLLYATLKNLRETLFVFSAIPLATIGGIVALWLRSMPFSISAGVGFIALFGVAVLNGIVLIGQMNRMEREGVADLRQRVVESCMARLRPVLMTALVASLGFLPMALSHGDGAEVQRPLATVVIGGLITSTLLTLLVLPAIYTTFSKSKLLHHVS